MSFVKKTIASAAAIAALVAVPTATAVADDAPAQDTAAVQSVAGQPLLSSLQIMIGTGFQEIDLGQALNGGYDMWVNDLKSVNLEAMTYSGHATSIAPAYVTSVDGMTMTVDIWAYGADGQSANYVVRFHKVPSQDTTLTYLNVDNYEIDLAQAQTANGYVINVDDLSAISGTVLASSTADGATLLSAGSAGDGVNSKAYMFYVVAEDGETISPTYTVRFVRNLSSDTSLSSLTVDGHVIDLAQAGTTYGYTITVKDPSAVNTSLIGGAWASGAKVVLNGTSTSTDGSVLRCVYTVVAEDGTQGASYQVNFAKAASSSTTLTSLTVDGYVVYDLAQGLTDATTTKGYTIKVKNPQAIDPSVIGGSWAAGADVKLGATVEGKNKVSYTYYVVAEDGTQGTASYKVTFKKAKKSSATGLTTLTVDGYVVYDAAKGLTDATTTEGYTVKVEDLSAIDPSVIGGSWAAGADVLLGGSSEAADGSSVSYTYYVVAEDGTQGTASYKVTFKKAKKSSATGLTSLTVDGYVVYDSAQGLTDATTTEGYTVKVEDPSAIDPSVIGGSWAAGADVLLGGSSEAADGSSVSYTYYVVAEDGTQGTASYKVTFKKAKKSSATGLTSLTVDGYVVYDPAQGLTDATTTDGHVITVDDPSAIDPNVIGGAWAAGADVKLGATVEGKNKVSYTYYVVAEDGTQGTASYKVTFKKAKKSSDATLTTLTVDGYVAYDAVKGPFDATTTDGHTFVVDDPSAIDPSVIGGAWAAGADVLLGGSSEAADGSSVSYFYYVVAEDGTRSEVTYKVNFVKAQDGETPTEPEEPGKDDETTTPAEDEQKADENKPDEKKSALGETGSAVLGVSVFALLLAAGSAVIFVMRKRA